MPRDELPDNDVVYLSNVLDVLGEVPFFQLALETVGRGGDDYINVLLCQSISKH